MFSLLRFSAMSISNNPQGLHPKTLGIVIYVGGKKCKKAFHFFQYIINSSFGWPLACQMSITVCQKVYLASLTVCMVPAGPRSLSVANSISAIQLLHLVFSDISINQPVHQIDVILFTKTF